MEACVKPCASSAALVAACVSIASLCLAACSSSSAGKTRYPAGHEGVAHKFDEGTIVATHDVIVDGQATNMGTIVGTAVGGAVGAISKTDIQDSTDVAQRGIATAVGAAAGAVLARHIEKELTKHAAQQLTIALDSGELVIIIQKAREPHFYEDERVRVYTTPSGDARVLHMADEIYAETETNIYIIGEEELAGDDVSVSWLSGR